MKEEIFLFPKITPVPSDHDVVQAPGASFEFLVL